MKALAILALAVALEAGFLLSSLAPAAPAAVGAAARPILPASGATAARGCDGGPRC